MEGSRHPHKAADRRWWLKLVALVVGAPIVILVILYLLWDHSARRGLEREIEKVRQSGAPLTVDDLIAEWYVTDAAGQRRLKTPYSENAAPVYQCAFDLLEELQLTDEDYELLREMLKTDDPSQWSEEDAEKLKALLGKTAEVLELTKQATEMEQCQFEIDWWGGTVMFPAHGRNLRYLNSLVLARALLKLRQGKGEEALEACRLALNMSRAVRDERLLMPVLMRFALLSSSLRAMEAAANALPAAPQVYRELIREIAAEEWDLQEHVRRALEGERALHFSLFTGLLEKGTFDISGSSFVKNYPPGYAWLMKSPMGRSIVRGDRVAYLRYMRRCVEAASQPLPRAVKESKAVAGELQEMRESTRARMRYPFTCMLAPGLRAITAILAEAVARCRVTEVGLALEMYNTREGKYPESLEELLPDFLPSIPEDPFTGAPLKFKRSEKGVVVYSVGPNEEDEGGAYDKDQARKKRLKDDIAWRITR